MRSSAWPFLLRKVALRAATALVPLMLLWLAARRGFSNFAPLPSAALVLVGIAAVAIVYAWRSAWKATEARGTWQVACQRYLPAACLALLAVALSIHGTHPLAMVLFWLMLVGAEAWWGWKVSSRNETVEHPHPGPLPQREGVEELHPNPLSRGDGDEEGESTLLPVGVSQQLTRAANASGETLDGLLRVEFAVGEQLQTVHVAFCPPLCFTPTAVCQAVDGADCDVKITSLETFGARLEIKRRGALTLADEAIVQMQVIARAT